MKVTIGRRAIVGIALSGVIFFAIGLRGFNLDGRSFWFDEAFSWRLIQFPIPEMLARAAGDVHPPLYYLVLRTWSAVFGESAAALRSMSVLFGALTVLGMYLFAREALPGGDRGKDRSLKCPGLALLVAALVGLSVFQIHWARETRMYALGTVLAAFSSWALFRALFGTPQRWRDWLLYGFLALLFAYTHYYALFALASQALFVGGYWLVQVRGKLWRVPALPSFWYAFVAADLVAVGWLPWVPVLARQWAQVQVEYWTRPVTFRDVQGLCYRVLVEPENPDFLRDDGLLAVALCGALLLAILWKARAGEWYVFTAAVTPLAICLWLSWRGTYVFHVRYFLFAHLFRLTAIAILVWRVPFPAGRVLTGALVLAGFLIADLDFCKKLDVANKPGARGAAAFVDRHRHPTEPVVVCSPLVYFAVLFHSEDRSGWSFYTDGRGVLHYEGAVAIVREDLIGEDELRAITSHRAWAVNMAGGSWGTRTVPVPSHWKEKSRQRFPEVHRVCGEVILVEYEVGQ